jgi:hypothetical protein
MNPGTLIFLVLGLIGLLIYASKAIKADDKEGFRVLEETDVSNKGREGLEKLKEGTLNFESLFSAFSTPDVNIDRPSKMNIGANPSVSDFMNKPPPQEPQALPLPAPEPVVSSTPIINKTPALPVLTPSSIINMPNSNEAPAQISSPPVTMSDIQGSILPKPLTKKPITEKYSSYKRKKRSKTKVIYKQNECPPMPDMSQYIRKDSIPCWGCNLK